MKITGWVLVAALGSGLLGAQSKAEESYVHAYFEEHANRDFAKAATLYTEAGDAARSEQKGALSVQAGEGLLRCLVALNRQDEARALARQLVSATPPSAAATRFLAESESRPADPDAERVNALIQREDESSIQELAALGPRALPALSQALRSPSTHTALAAAKALARAGNREGAAMLATAIKDPTFVAAIHLVAYLMDSRTSIDALWSVVAAGVDNPDPLVARTAASIFVKRGLSSKESVQRTIDELIVRVATHRVAAVRLVILDGLANEPNHEIPGLAVALRESLESGDRQLVLGALNALPRLLMNETQVPAEVSLVALRAAAGFIADDDSVARGQALRVLGCVGLSWPEDVGAALVRRGRDLLRSGAEPLSFDLFRAVANAKASKTLDGNQLLELAVSTCVDPERDRLNLYRRQIFQRVAKPGSGVDAAAWFEKLLDEASCVPLRAAAVGNGPVVAQSDVYWKLALNDPAPAVRRQAYYAYASSREQATAVPPSSAPQHLVEDLGADDLQIVGAAQLVVPLFPDPILLAPLRKVLASVPAGEKPRVLESLIEIGGVEAVPDVMAWLKSDVNDGVTRMLMRELYRKIGPAALETMVAGAARIGRAAVPLSGLPLSHDGKTPDQAPVLEEPFLRAYLDRIDPAWIDAQLLRIADEVVPDRVPALVVAGLQHAAPHYRGDIAAYAGTRHVAAAAPYLVGMLDDPDSQVRTEAQRSLEAIRAYRALKTEFGPGGSEARADAMTEAMRLVRSAKPGERRSAAFALGALGEPASIAALLRLVEDLDPDVGAAAAKALEAITTRALDRAAPESKPTERR